MEMTLGGVSLLALFLETLFYGVFLTLYWITLFILLKKSGIQRELLIPVVTLLLCLATAHLIIDFIRALEAFIFQVNTIGADAYYSNLASSLELAKMTLYITQTILADSVILWRCYVIFNRSLLIAIPGCVVLLNNGGTFVPATAWMDVFYILSMIISNTCTILIARRIYRTRRFMSGGLAALLPIFIVILESGALYAMSVVALIVTLLTRSNGQYIVLDIVAPIMVSLLLLG
ncbi:hypothetical protein AZE42_10619 [Rhizopogon vesiculosus]|uniref:Uncharacterized protein n=1 Tax=Rhizopogon vesiculosus TaxID=180088 RepID=A0A1J8QB01_9AGAM|nr:hypothetical protein AZE42_10619 [Rhizopogon vesiculosus]